ncbi:uncharacterized protein [Periplaneta americana]|uniref:uncharacterized protein n=1 Tax=Periplaneta americana TaxID=6978 RepID=UPI0037E75683
MPRTYVKKTTHGSWSKVAMEEAVTSIKEGRYSIRKAANVFGVPFSTLQRRTSASEDSPVLTVGRKPVLSLDVERALATRLIYLSKRGFGLTPKTVRKYAYQYVSTREIQHNFNIQNEMAGEDWFQGFLRRNPELSLRKSEGLSRARINGMTRDNVDQFYEQLKKLTIECNLEGRPECLYNQDETGLPMNNKPPNVVAQKGSRDVVSLTNVERGENVTVMACVSATGAYIPPFVIFKGKRMRAEFSDNMPAGTEVCMTESGWVNEEAFGKWLKHFNKHRTPGKVILILDGHHSHTSFATADLCEKYGIEVLLLPPHTTHALQPLDVCIFKPLKSYYNSHGTSWQHSNPNRAISKLSFGSIFKKAWDSAATVGNGVKGFEVTGIYPLNRTAIASHKFVSEFGPNQDNSSVGLNDVSPEPKSPEQPPNSSQLSRPTATPEASTSHEDVRSLLPSPAKITPMKRRKTIRPTSLVLTSPENISQLKAKAAETKKRIARVQKKGDIKKKKQSVNIICDSSEEDEETEEQKDEDETESVCNFCKMSYNDDRSSHAGDWIQCQKCKLWYHERCVNAFGRKQFVCGICMWKK